MQATSTTPTQPWSVTPFTDTYELPKFLYEIRVKDWTLPLVGDYQGCVVAYIAGGNWDDPDALPVAQAHAELIASAPALKAENDRLRLENEALHRLLKAANKRLNRERDYAEFLESKYSNEVQS